MYCYRNICNRSSSSFYSVKRRLLYGKGRTEISSKEEETDIRKTTSLDMFSTVDTISLKEYKSTCEPIRMQYASRLTNQTRAL